jgi:glycosyltransferase involved in cell wall biosynthesis
MTTVDVCLFLEGTYPYVAGGVSSWVHELIKAQKNLSFAVVTILANDKNLKRRYEMPPNVVHFENVLLNQLHKGKSRIPKQEKFFEIMENNLNELLKDPSISKFSDLLQTIQPHQNSLGAGLLLNSHNAWNMLQREYGRSYPEESFLDFFWSWRGLTGSLFSVLLPKLPEARVYHSLCTGYAGLMLARAAIEKKKPTLLTEHGIYTNERRIEIASAEWLNTANYVDFGTCSTRRSLRDFWIGRFGVFSKVCYEICDRIVTLFSANQQFQILDGAKKEKLLVIPNGINLPHFIDLARNTDPNIPTVALIGRVVPIKDVKTFLRGMALLHQKIPTVRVWVLGPTEEDEEYYQECKALADSFSKELDVQFLGKVNMTEYLSKIDVVVLSSISEAQPLVLLEAGAAGVPCVATNVGDCRDLLGGREAEDQALGSSGLICPLADPEGLAEQTYTLLTDKELYQRCAKTAKKRTKKYYSVDLQNQRYSDLYGKLLEESLTWQA